MNRITGRSAFLALLKDEGVSHLFGNPGTTELPIMYALDEHPDLTYVLGLQEAVVLAMADGYARASGKLVACNVHVAPGLGNAMGALFNAKFTGTPMILTAGQQEQGHGLTEPMLYDSLVPIAEPLVKWAVEVTRLQDLPRIIRRAAKVALTPPTGPVFLSLPGDVLNEEAGLELGTRTRVDAAARPSDATLERLATRLLAAERPVILVGPEVASSNALEDAARFAEVLGAPVYQQTIPWGAHFLSEHPAFMGALSRNQPDVRQTLEPYDLMVCLGADMLRMSVYHEVDPLPPTLSVVQIGQIDWEMGKNYAADMAVRADVKETLSVLTPLLTTRGSDAQRQKAAATLEGLEARNWSANRAALLDRLDESAAPVPVTADWLMARLVENLPQDAVVVDEGVTSTRLLTQLYPFRGPRDFHGLASGGIGWGIAAAVGIQLAEPERPVVAVIGDGSAMYSIQALWTAAHHKLPMTYVIPNNGGYKILRQRLHAFHGGDNYVGMRFVDPPIDFVGLARSFGLEACRVDAADDVVPALKDAFSHDGPNLIEVMVED